MTDLVSSPSSFGNAAVELFYDGKLLYPAPLIGFDRRTNRNEQDEPLSVEDTYTLTGLYLNETTMGYETVVTNMEVLKVIFANDGKELQIKAGAGNATLPSGTLITSGIYPFVESIGIPESNQQFHRFDYEVVLVSKVAASGVSGVISSSSDNWVYSENPDRLTTTVAHTANAVGVNTNVSGVSNALTNAKAFVDARIGATAVPAGYPSYVFPGDVDGDASTIFEFQRTRTETVNVEAGSYEVTETFVYVSGTVPFSDGRTYQYDKDREGISTVQVNGRINGLHRSDGTDEPFAAFYNAQSGFSNDLEPYIHTEATEVYTRYSGSGTLFSGPVSYSLTEDRFNGTLSYAIQYTDDPKENLPSGIVEQSISVQRKDSIRLRQSHVIPQRRLGNIVQDIGTPTPGQIRINASARAENTGDEVADTNRAISHIQDLINQQRPNPADFIQLYVSEKDQTHDKKSLTASAVIVYDFIVDLATVQEANTDVLLNPVT